MPFDDHSFPVSSHPPKFTTWDQRLMRLALALAERGRGHVEPNPMVGALIVRGGEVVGRGWHRRFGGPHAEVEALRSLSDPALARGATLFVTLEPCCHVGKTPPCTQAILEAGITRVVAAMADPFPKVAGGGLAALRAAGVEVCHGLEETAARRLNAAYLKRVLMGRPYVTAKWAMTLDGKSAAATGDSRWISNERSRARVHELRGRMDAIVVGIGTALADDPLLTVRPPGPRTPTRIVLDSQARLPLSSRLVRTIDQAPLWLVHRPDAPADRLSALEHAGVKLFAPQIEDMERYCASGVPIAPLLDELGREGMTHLLVEGGGRVAGAFFDAGAIDALEVFIAPRVIGGTARFAPLLGQGRPLMAQAARFIESRLEILDGDLRLVGRFAHAWLDETEPPAFSADGREADGSD
jgi:diaminohydroxyphosphoribosylaminopyrimidine deaminase/5-amino-6-(5-phosphoribosylamino)uracil reductase